MASTKVKGEEKRQGLGLGGLFLPSLPGAEKNSTPVSHTRMGWDESGMVIRKPLSPLGVPSVPLLSCPREGGRAGSGRRAVCGRAAGSRRVFYP